MAVGVPITSLRTAHHRVNFPHPKEARKRVTRSPFADIAVPRERSLTFMLDTGAAVSFLPSGCCDSVSGSGPTDEGIPRRTNSEPGERDMARLHTVSGQNRRLSKTIDGISKNQATTRREMDSEIRLLRNEFVMRQGELLADDLEKVNVGSERRKSSQLPRKLKERRVTLPNVMPIDDGVVQEPTTLGISMEKIHASIGLQVERHSRRRESCHATAGLRRCSTAPGVAMEESRFGDISFAGHISHKVNPGRKHSLAIVSREQMRSLQIEENRRFQREATFDGRFQLLLESLQPNQSSS